MKKHNLVLLILLQLGFYGFCQKEASNWYFGDNAGIKFNADGTVSELNNGRLSTIEGCATISDNKGNLLFYTDGTTVFNKNHSVMANGYNLFGNTSSTQSAIIIPQPKSSTIFYIFTVDTINFEGDINSGFNYSIVDMSLEGGLGKVIDKNVNLLTSCSEKVSAVVKDCATQATWVITFAPSDKPYYDTFYAYEVTDTGLNIKPVKSTFLIAIDDQRGYLKFSPDGTKLACANVTAGLYLYDFDKATGTVSNQENISLSSLQNKTKPQFAYGLEFSQNNKLLYVSSYFENLSPSSPNDQSQYGALFQYNILAPNISRSEVIIDQRETYRSGLQLGPNGKIYRSMNKNYTEGTPYLSVINNPNIEGIACDYVNNSIVLKNYARQGLPPFITSFFTEKIDIIKNKKSSIELFLCDGDTYNLEGPLVKSAEYIWTHNGDTLPNTTNQLKIDKSGLYTLLVNPKTSCEQILEGIANVVYNPNPKAYNYTLVQCDEDGKPGGYTHFNLTQANPAVTNNVSGLSVAYYTDAALKNNISNPENYNYNTDAPIPIYAKVSDVKTACYNVSEVTLTASTNSYKELYPDALCDELNSEDGLNTFDLNAITIQIQTDLGKDAVVNYYQNYNDALLEEHKLNLSYKNVIPYNESIYVRIEKNNSCFNITKVHLSVTKLPQIDSEQSVYYCLNKAPEQIPLNSGLTDNVLNYTFLWSTGETTPEIKVNQIGKYTVTVKNKSQCEKTQTISVIPSNIATFKKIDVTDVSDNNSITAIVSGEGKYQYALFDEFDNLIYNYQESNTFAPIKSGIYKLYVKDILNNCGIVMDLVSVIGFPKVFTPNGDGFNDTWQISGANKFIQPESKIQIFDRQGKLLKILSPNDTGWDGTFNNSPLPADDYWFYITLQDGREFKNHFSLKR